MNYPPYFMTAYGLAVKKGFVGTEEEWLKSLEGAAAKVEGFTVEYQESETDSSEPGGEWSRRIPQISRGSYLWTRVTIAFNTGNPIVFGWATKYGMDGMGTVTNVNGVSADPDGTVHLDAESLKALSILGGTMEGAINMGGKTLEGLKTPEKEDDAVPKSYADQKLPKAGGTMEGKINMGGKAIENLPDPMGDADAATKKYTEEQRKQAEAYADTFSRKNLLDNWYFKNPVNQQEKAGKITLTGEYFLDRWILEAGNVELTSGGLVLNGTITQILDEPAGAEAKASVLTNEGVTDASYFETVNEDGSVSFKFKISGNGQTVIAAKLERGRTQTLAHEEHGKGWVLNETPDFREQTLRCMCHFIRYKSESANLYMAIGMGNSEETTVYFDLHLPVPMRKKPEIGTRGLGTADQCAVYAPGSNSIAVNEITASQCDSSSGGVKMIRLAAKANGITAGKTYWLRLGEGFYFDLKAREK